MLVATWRGVERCSNNKVGRKIVRTIPKRQVQVQIQVQTSDPRHDLNVMAHRFGMHD